MFRTYLSRQLNQFLTLPPEPAIHPEVARRFRHNVLVNGADSTAWLLGDSFLSATTILPVFASRFTSSPLVIGLIPALLNAGWFLPQLFMTPLVERLPRKLPALSVLTAIERLPFLGLAVMAVWLDRMSQPLAVGLFLFLIAWRALSSGLAALPWQELIATVIPVSHRGRYFGCTHLLGQLVGVAGAALAALLLSRLPFPGNYAVVFLIGFLCVVVSYIFLVKTIEPAVAPQVAPRYDNQLFLARTLCIVRSDANFRAFLISRAVSYTGSMASGFLTVYAVEYFNLPDSQAAVFTAVLLVGSMFGFAISGAIGDRWGYKPVLAGAGGLWIAALGVALLVPSVPVFYGVFGLVGLSNAGSTIADLNIAMEFSAAADRPMYLGLARTSLGPVLFLAPLIGGQVAELGGYPLVLSVSVALTLVALALLWWTVVEPRQLAASAPNPEAQP